MLKIEEKVHVLIKNPEIFEKIQEELFKQNIVWCGTGRGIWYPNREKNYKEKPFVITIESAIGYIPSGDMHYYTVDFQDADFLRKLKGDNQLEFSF